MGARKRKNIELHKSLEDLSIYRFDKIINGDLRYLANVENVTKVKISQAYNDVWKELYNEYAKKTKNNTTVRIYLLLGEINYLTLRFNIVPQLIDVVLSAVNKEIFELAITEIESWGFRLNKDAPIGKEIEKVIKAINNSQTKIKRKLEEYKELTKEKEKALSLVQQKVKLERILGFTIDIKKTNVLEWLSYWDEVKLITSKKEKALANG